MRRRARIREPRYSPPDSASDIASASLWQHFTPALRPIRQDAIAVAAKYSLSIADFCSVTAWHAYVLCVRKLAATDTRSAPGKIAIAKHDNRRHVDSAPLLIRGTAEGILYHRAQKALAAILTSTTGDNIRAGITCLRLIQLLHLMLHRRQRAMVAGSPRTRHGEKPLFLLLLSSVAMMAPAMH